MRYLLIKGKATTAVLRYSDRLLACRFGTIFRAICLSSMKGVDMPVLTDNCAIYKELHMISEVYIKLAGSLRVPSS